MVLGRVTSFPEVMGCIFVAQGIFRDAGFELILFGEEVAID